MKRAGAAACWLVAFMAAGCASGRGAPPAPVPPALVGAALPAPLPLVSPEAELPRPALTYRVARSLDRPPRVKGPLDVPLGRQWKYILIHHSGTDEGSEATIDRYHREVRHWKGVGYDFLIGNGRGSPDGLVEVTFRWEQQITGAHAGDDEYNERGIGICLIGDFNKDHPTARQMEALVGLVNHLQERCQIPTSQVLLHRHVRPGGTECPGRNFPFYELISLLEH